MVNKCAVFGYKRGYESEEPQHEDYHAFYFPLDERKSHLLPAWEKFICRDGWKPSANYVDFSALLALFSEHEIEIAESPKNWQKGIIATVVNR